MNVHSAIARSGRNERSFRNSVERRRHMGKASKVILITGATTGIGKHTALHFARQGHRVFATGRQEKLLADLRAEAGASAIETLRLDVTDSASIESARAEVERRVG